jgi:RhoGEF domain
LDEIVGSEETYVKQLRVLVKVYLNPLKAWTAESKDNPVSAGA